MYSVQYSVQCTVYREVTSQDLVIGDSVQESCRRLERRMQEEVRRAERRTPGGRGAEYDSGVASSKMSLDKEVEDFLIKLDLEKLKTKFAKQELTYNDILDFDEEFLVAIKVDLVKDRRKILKEIEKLKKARRRQITSDAGYSSSYSNSSSSNREKNEEKMRQGKEDNMLKSSNLITKYSMKEKIGGGAFGEAWKVSQISNKAIFIMKKIPVRAYTDREKEAARNEISNLKRCRHENIVKHHG